MAIQRQKSSGPRTESLLNNLILVVPIYISQMYRGRMLDPTDVQQLMHMEVPPVSPSLT